MPLHDDLNLSADGRAAVEANILLYLDGHLLITANRQTLDSLVDDPNHKAVAAY